MTEIDQEQRTQGGPGQHSGVRWLWVIIAWVIAIPVAGFSLALLWALNREYGAQDAGQYVLMLPAAGLVALAVGLTVRVLRMRRPGRSERR
jgi:hypothetical protein